jgi:hypothetical protein
MANLALCLQGERPSKHLGNWVIQVDSAVQRLARLKLIILHFEAILKMGEIIGGITIGKEEANIESPDGLIVFAKTATELGKTSRRPILSTSTAGHFHIFIGII